MIPRTVCLLIGIAMLSVACVPPAPAVQPGGSAPVVTEPTSTARAVASPSTAPPTVAATAAPVTTPSVLPLTQTPTARPQPSTTARATAGTPTSTAVAPTVAVRTPTATPARTVTPTPTAIRTATLAATATRATTIAPTATRTPEPSTRNLYSAVAVKHGSTLPVVVGDKNDDYLLTAEMLPQGCRIVNVYGVEYNSSGKVSQPMQTTSDARHGWDITRQSSDARDLGVKLHWWYNPPGGANVINVRINWVVRQDWNANCSLAGKTQDRP